MKMGVRLRLAIGVPCAAIGLTGCGNPPEAPLASQPETVPIDRSLSAVDIDPAIYFAVDDPDDPFGEIYAQFRTRRASDIADASKPPAIEPYQPAHFTRDVQWQLLDEVFALDWAAVRAEAPEAVIQLENAVKVRLGLDHPDLKITQLMLGPGAVLPGHAGGAPGIFYVIGGAGEITVEGETQTVTPGTTIKLNPYDVRRIVTTSTDPLKIVWIRWAPRGDQAYLAAGYYLTGANQHIQPLEAELASDYAYWDTAYTSERVSAPAVPMVEPADGSIYAAQNETLQRLRAELGAQRDLYPGVPAFVHENDIPWLDAETIKNANFFWAKDVQTLGSLLTRWSEVMRYKGFFQARRPDGGWDFNISEMVWGPHARYVEHSHSIPEFYYMMTGPVEHWIGTQKYRAMPGDIFVTNSYVPHQSRGVVDGMPFKNIGASWAPNGDREVFERPFFLVEPLPVQKADALLGADARFH
jgi:quercetin dioxygenase-like cupin family protein